MTSSSTSLSSWREKVYNTPFANSIAIALCVCTYVIQVVVEPPVHHYTMNPRFVIYLKEYYRLITSCLFHGNLMHIGMNMMSAAAIGYPLEKKCGTLSHGITILWSMILTSSLYVFISLLLYVVFGYDHLMYQHSLGFSGVLFHLSVLQAHYCAGSSSRDVFGFFRVSSTVYPWVLLLVLQFLMPNLSFLGHLSGILVGTLQVHGTLDSLILPSHDYLRKLEQKNFFQSIDKPGFIKTPSEEEIRAFMPRREPGSFQAALVNGICIIWKLVRDIAETIKVCIFGYGSSRNQNIYFSPQETAALGFHSNNNPSVGHSVDDGDWIGLPENPSSQTQNQQV